MRAIKVDPPQPQPTYTLTELTRNQMVTLTFALNKLAHDPGYSQSARDDATTVAGAINFVLYPPRTPGYTVNPEQAFGAGGSGGGAQP